MWSDDVKAEAISRCSDGRGFVMTGGDLSTVRFPDDPMYKVPSVSRLEAMCDVVQKEFNFRATKPTLSQQLESLWNDIHNGQLNTDGTFYQSLKPHLHK